MTSIPGVYAAGDITRSTHNATLASADGVIAVDQSAGATIAASSSARPQRAAGATAPRHRRLIRR